MKKHFFGIFGRINANYMEFTAQTERIARAYNLTPQDVIFAHAIASGAPMGDAYALIYRTPPKTTTAQAEELARAHLDNNPGAKILARKLRNGRTERAKAAQEEEQAEQAGELTEEEKDEFCTKNGLVRKIVTSIKSTTGKDRVTALVTLAKLQGLDKPDEDEGEERRRYFLPWVSRCRTCELMRIYCQMSAKAGL